MAIYAVSPPEINIITPVTTGPLSTSTPPVSTTDTSILAATIVVAYSPFDADGEVLESIDVSEVGSGACWRLSVFMPRLDAWRCIDDEAGILDPCFWNTWHPDAVVCPRSPWERDASLISAATRMELMPTGIVELEQQLEDAGSGRVWALELVNGERCLSTSGAEIFVAGERRDFICEGGGAISGLPTDGRIWIAFYAGPESGSAISVDVVKVWR